MELRFIERWILRPRSDRNRERARDQVIFSTLKGGTGSQPGAAIPPPASTNVRSATARRKSVMSRPEVDGEPPVPKVEGRRQIHLKDAQPVEMKVELGNVVTTRNRAAAENQACAQDRRRRRRNFTDPSLAQIGSAAGQRVRYGPGERPRLRIEAVSRSPETFETSTTAPSQPVMSWMSASMTTGVPFRRR